MKLSDAEAATQLAKSAEIPITIARLLIQRGIATPETAKTFLNPALEQLHSPFEMLGMQAALVRIQRAICDKEPILIYGDYDVDGTTAVVILKTCIELLGATADFHVPHRIREGYGMKDDVIENAAENGIKLVISVDTGIRAFQAAETARRVGLDLIVTDHHLPDIAESLPYALAVLNPNQPDCKYPCKDLCGAGVAFKIAQALLTEAGPQFERLIPSFIKMVAIATIADSVPLVGENRVFAKLGLDGLRRPVNGGLKALMQVAQLDAGGRAGRSIRATDIAFRVAPRINAAGRMDIAKDVVELFTTRDETRSRELANKLNELNSDRQAEEARIIGKIHALLDSDATLAEAFCLVIAGEGWHRGVIGIAATRVVERTGKPALVIAIDGDEAHGSGRSISAFHLLDALESEHCRPLFTRFGGHAHAVGFSMKREQVEPLRRALDAYARTRLTVEDFVPVLSIDAEITLEEITPEWMRCLQMLEPYGMGNREPVFVARGLRVQQPPKVLKEKHIKLRLTQVDANGKQHRGFDALGWRMAERIQEQGLVVGEMVDLAFTVEENVHPEFGGLQLIICDLVRAGKAVASSP
ncbi:MAG: exonuclease RecJ [Candidatus Angelobacter sp.]|jgi:single-stranded-DNA-specific exonuclease|nr:exonuclease RecJ [Candidatus Angelobacter sp.]